MPGASATKDIELIIEDIGGGGGKIPPTGGNGGAGATAMASPIAIRNSLHQIAITPE